MTETDRTFPATFVDITRIVIISPKTPEYITSRYYGDDGKQNDNLLEAAVIYEEQTGRRITIEYVEDAPEILAESHAMIERWEKERVSRRTRRQAN